MQSQHKHKFAEVPGIKIARSAFNRSCRYLTTLNAGDLCPIFLDEILPGDTVSMKTTLFCRLNTPLTPIMDNLYLDTHWFYIPNRLLWDNWEDFITGKNDTLLVPVTHLANELSGQGELSDYFGIPIGTVDTDEINALPFRAYNLIYNEWYRSQDLQSELTVDTDDGPDDGSDYVIKKRGKRHDYFTSCLPWPQKGEAIDLPLGGEVPIVGNGKALGLEDNNQTPMYLAYDVTFADLRVKSPPVYTGDDVSGSNSPSQSDNAIGVSENAADSGLIADLSDATAATINSLREAFQLQRMLERDARAGSRMVENILSHFGVRVPDYRAQRPEYLGGSSTRINITPVAQTSENNDTDGMYLGDLGGFGHAADQGYINKSFVEHGYIMCIASVRQDLTYQQGLDRQWSRQTRYDYYWPSLANLGEQEVYNKEIYYQADKGGDNEDNEVFGYNERYAEYRYKRSLVTNFMSSLSTQPLDAWHLAQEFLAKPTLGGTFIQENAPMERVCAVTEAPDFKLEAFFDFKHIRPMPIYGVPGMIDHF